MEKIIPFLWFGNNAEEAVNFYLSVFKNSRIKDLKRYGPDMPMPEGTVLTIDFELNGNPFVAINGGPVYSFNPSVSFMVYCDDQAEVDYYWDKLSSSPADEQCGWLKDKFGLSWQIVPKDFHKYIFNPDNTKAKKAMQAMMQMKKLDIDELRKASEA